MRKALWIHPLLLVSVFLTIGTVSAGETLLIDFETLPGNDGKLGTADDVTPKHGEKLLRQFMPMGITFGIIYKSKPGYYSGSSDSYTLVEAGNSAQPQGFQGTGTNMPASSGRFTISPTLGNMLDGDLVIGLAKPASRVSITLIDEEMGGTFEMRAEGIENNARKPLKTITYSSSNNGDVKVLTIEAPGIRRIDLVRTNDPGIGFDDLTIEYEGPDVVAAAPEPRVNVTLSEVTITKTPIVQEPVSIEGKVPATVAAAREEPEETSSSVFAGVLDIVPGNCQNTIGKKGNVKAVILGGGSVSNADIKKKTISLEGVSPHRKFKMKDVASSDCSKGGKKDGKKDLILTFKTADILSAIETKLGRPAKDGESVELTLNAQTVAGENLVLKDTVVISLSGRAMWRQR